MSFSSQLKEELSKTNNLNKKNEVLYELIGYLISKNASIVKNNVRYATESDYNINRYSKLLKNLDIDYDIAIDGKAFTITFKVKNNIEGVKFESDSISIYKNAEELNVDERRAIIRGAFLGGGSINNPEKKYHLEINLSNKNNMAYLINILEDMNIKIKRLEQDNKYSVYIKEGEEISSFIALVGANKGVLRFEDVRVQREMRGKVNRIVNCKAANLNKTINASVEQIDAIKKLQENGTFNKLDDNLKEIALLRLEYPDISLIELGKKLKQPLGKSGVNYRLQKIIQISME